ncbi:MAG: GNAT family N-acetyltransferase [Bowdeniella nasicola]|nr:GNAT family N-acetyltransferase [Bowdeniella nasicola]
MADLAIDVIGVEQAGELMTVRRAAFVTEAQVYGDPHLPVLTETLEEIRQDIAREDVVTLGAWIAGRLVGSIRVAIEGTRAKLGRLAVTPDLQKQGIGTALLLKVLEYLPEDIVEVWVFTAQDKRASLDIPGLPGHDEDFDSYAGGLTYSYLQRLLGGHDSEIVDAFGAPEGSADRDELR